MTDATETTDTKYRPKTLNEINKININTVKNEALDMCDYVLNNKMTFSRDNLTSKYNYLFTTVPSLFNKILRDINDDINKISRPHKDGVNKIFIFNKIEFETNLSVVLKQLLDIQNNQLKNEDLNTHKIISNKFNEIYIPAKFLEK
jgi:hypothetical protein